MTLNLILQGPGATDSAIERIAALAAPAFITQFSTHAYRCSGVRYDKDLQEKIETACQEAQIDATFIETGRQLDDFGLLVMDMDSTLITIECIDEIADLQGLKPQVAAITQAAMRGEMEFGESLQRRVALLQGLDASALQKVYDERLQLSPGAAPLLAAVKAAGLKTLLVSGGFTFFTERIQARLQLDYAHANVLEIIDGKLSGRVLGNIVDAAEKKSHVEKICQELGISPQQAIVMGDGANDLKMMGIAGLSVAYRAKPIVRAQADVALNFSGLDGILSLFE